MKSVALARTIRTGLAPSRSLQADPAPFEQIPRRPDSRRASRFDMIVRFFRIQPSVPYSKRKLRLKASVARQYRQAANMAVSTL